MDGTLTPPSADPDNDDVVDDVPQPDFGPVEAMRAAAESGAQRGDTVSYDPTPQREVPVTDYSGFIPDNPPSVPGIETPGWITADMEAGREALSPQIAALAGDPTLMDLGQFFNHPANRMLDGEFLIPEELAEAIDHMSRHRDVIPVEWKIVDGEYKHVAARLTFDQWVELGQHASNDLMKAMIRESGLGPLMDALIGRR